MTVHYTDGRTKEARVITIPVAVLSAIISLAIAGTTFAVAWGRMSTEIGSIRASLERIERNSDRQGEKLDDVRMRVKALETSERRP